MGSILNGRLELRTEGNGRSLHMSYTDPDKGLLVHLDGILVILAMNDGSESGTGKGEDHDIGLAGPTGHHGDDSSGCVGRLNNNRGAAYAMCRDTLDGKTPCKSS